MQVQKQGKESETLHKQQRKRVRFFWLRIVGFTIIVLAIIIKGIFFIKTPTNSSLSNILGEVFLIVGVLFALFQLNPIICPSKQTPTTVIQHFHSRIPTPTTIVNLPGVQSSPVQKSSAHIIFHTSLPVFLINKSPLPHIDEYYGKVRERIALISTTWNERSISLVVPRRIGKTWLMDYLNLITPTELSMDFQLARLDGTQPHSKSVSEFNAMTLDAFDVPLATRQTNLELDMSERLVKNLQAKHITPVPRNEVISKRLVKKQQMRGTKEGAHHQLQVRVQVFNDELRQTFCHWYPNTLKASIPTEESLVA